MVKLIFDLAEQGVWASKIKEKLGWYSKWDINKAMSYSEFEDLEDALQMQCFKKIKGDFIITRDEKFRKISDKAISPKDFINNMGGQ